MPRRNEMKTGAASSSGVFYEAFCGDAAKYEAHLAMHEAAQRAMKRKPDGFIPPFLGQKKWRLAFLSPPAILKRILSSKTQNFDVK